jgi:DNA-binding FadR family transcriptional regulator
MSKLRKAAANGNAPPPRERVQPRLKIAERVAAELRREIVTGKLRPGDKLHNERELQDQFEISRPTLREALRLLEAESLITVTRGQHGGARVQEPDPNVLARQVGACLQMKGATLRDIWQARTLIEPGAARMVTDLKSREASEAMRANIAAATAALDDPVAYGRLTNEFSLILTEHCGNITLHIFATLIQDIVAAQHVDVTVRTYAKAGGDRMRELNIRSRERLLGFVEAGDSAAAENFWREHLEESGKVVFSAYQAGMPIDMVPLPSLSGAQRAIG